MSVDISKFTNPMINTNFIFTLYHTKINYNFYSDQHTYLKIKNNLELSYSKGHIAVLNKHRFFYSRLLISYLSSAILIIGIDKV